MLYFIFCVFLRGEMNVCINVMVSAIFVIHRKPRTYICRVALHEKLCLKIITDPMGAAASCTLDSPSHRAQPSNRAALCIVK